MSNLLYEISEEKKIIATLQENKISNKIFYYDKLEKLDFSQPSYFFLEDKKFNFYYKTFFFNQEDKFTIKQLQEFLKSFEFKKNEIFIGYMINNIKVYDKSSNYLLGKKWKISFWIGVYTLENKHLEFIKQIFWKNYSIKIFPNSLFSIQCISKLMPNWTFVYLGKEKTKIIQIKNWFYYKVEHLPLWLNYIQKEIDEIFKNIKLNALTDFQKKVYIKKLTELLQPIAIFIKSNLISDQIYIIWNFENFPKLLEELSNSIKTKILPLPIDNKKFSTIHDLDLYCIWKNYDKIRRY